MSISNRLAISGLLFLWAAQAGAVLINEIRIDQPGPDRDEYFELAGAPGASLDGLSYLVIGDRSGAGSGVIEAVVGLDGLRLSAAGLLLVAERSFSLGPVPDRVTGLNFENGDNVTHLLVRGFSGTLHEDLDGDDDGVLDARPWDALLDSVALVDDPLGGDHVYSAAVAGPEAGGVPAHVFRDGAAPGGWRLASAWGEDTPGAPNPGAAPVSPPDPAMTVDAPPLPWLLALGGALMMAMRRRAASASVL